MKNVAYIVALSAGLLTMSGCEWFGCGKKAAAPTEATPLAENEVATEAAVETTAVASAEAASEDAVEAAATEADTTVVAEATMPMNEVAAEQQTA